MKILKTSIILLLAFLLPLLMSSEASAGSKLVARAKGETFIRVESGAEAILEVIATSSGMIYYQWYTVILTPSGEIIEGEVSNKYSAGSSGHYRCIVTDSLGGRVSVDFDVSVDNELYAEAEENGVFDWDTNATGEMKVLASCKKGDLHYKWYRIDRISYDSSGGYFNFSYGENQLDCSSNRLITEKNSSYLCIISDNYGNSTQVLFLADTHTSVRAAEDSDLLVARGSDIVLAVIAESPSNIFSYQWKIDREMGPPIPITNENSKALIIHNIQESKHYYCSVESNYDESFWIDFNVIISETQGKTRWILELPSSLESIEERAFSKLTCHAVFIPDGCTMIGEHAFDGCSNLSYVHIPASVIDYPENAFGGCKESIFIDHE